MIPSPFAHPVTHFSSSVIVAGRRRTRTLKRPERKLRNLLIGQLCPASDVPAPQSQSKRGLKLLDRLQSVPTECRRGGKKGNEKPSPNIHDVTGMLSTLRSHGIERFRSRPSGGVEAYSHRTTHAHVDPHPCSRRPASVSITHICAIQAATGRHRGQFVP